MSKLKKIVNRENPNVAFAASLPERTVRSLAALAGGITTFVTDTVLPEPVRQTTIYSVTFGTIQQFMVERVGEVAFGDGLDDGEVSAENDLDNFAQRKLAGNMLEAAGLLTVGFSPLWVFAIAGDVAGGSKVFLNRLVEQLKENEIIAEDAEINDLVDALEAAQSASKTSAAAFDRPPLSREQLTTFVDELRQSYRDTFTETTDLLPEMEEIWQTMQRVTKRENISFGRLSGIMTGDVTLWGEREQQTAAAARQVAADLFDEKVLDSYRQTLTAISEQGANNYVGDHFKPFLRAAATHYDREKLSWTERKLLKKDEDDSAESTTSDQTET